MHTYTPVRIALPFIAGIIPGLHSSMGVNPNVPLSFAFLFSLGFLITWHTSGSSFGTRWLPGFLANISLFLLGLAVITVNSSRKEAVISKLQRNINAKAFICSIESEPTGKSAFYTCKAAVVAGLDSTGHWNFAESGILIYFKEDSACLSLEYGDRVLVYGKIQPIPEPSNPYTFNFKKYMYERNVFYQVYLDTGHWIRIGKERENVLYRFAGRCRNGFLDVFRKFGINDNEFALVSALLLGVTEYLDPETRQEFSNAGATHILSVSGLHVAIVYAAADKILFFLKRGRRSRVIHSVIIIMFIWFYALITGLTVSVVRASLMFSLVGAANLLRRSSWNYNILVVAAFLQLWINPFEILDIGFQLSYLAVLGIFAFYQPFNGLMQSGNRLMGWIWPVLAVSCAAQLTTSPMACHYFHMFPTYFLLTNLIVVPLSGFIIYLSLGLLAVSYTGLDFSWLAWPLNQSLVILERSVEWIQDWPGAVIRNIVISPAQVCLIFIFIISFYGVFILRNKRWIYGLLGSVLLFLSILVYDNYKGLINNQITVYNISGHSAIDLFSRKGCLCVCDSMLLKNERKINFQVVPNRINERAFRTAYIGLENDTAFLEGGIRSAFAFMSFSGKHIVILEDQLQDISPGREQITCDLLIIRGNRRMNPDGICGSIRAKQVVIDSSVPSYKALNLKNQLLQRGLTVHSVREKGAYIQKW